MIPAHELRIGNYGQLWHFWRCRWTEILKLKGKHIGWIEESKIDFKPINLSEEIILKAGAKKEIIKSRIGDIAEFHFDGFCLVKQDHMEGNIWAVFNQTTPHPLTEISYLHRLQNWHFELNNKELEIKL